jgi:hypothetical protein
MIVNPLAAIRYHMWGDPTSSTFASSAKALWKGSGMKAFLRGAAPTITRDIVFGCVYEVGRKRLRRKYDLLESERGDEITSWRTQRLYYFGADVIAAAGATVASSPFNFVRNIQYGARADMSPKSTVTALRMLLSDAAAAGWRAPIFLQRRLLIGWGTTRVAVSLGFGQIVYEWLQGKIHTE